MTKRRASKIQANYNMTSSFYFETSAVNSLHKLFTKSDFGSVPTKALQISKGRRWYISAVTLFEIFQTKNEEIRYQLFDFCRCLFFDYLIASPEEIIINYINSNCPSLENKYCLDSSGILSKEWHDACTNLEYAFQPDQEQIKSWNEGFYFISKYLYKKQNGYELKSYIEINDSFYKFLGIRLDVLLQKLLDELGKEASEESKQNTAISFYIALVVVCYGITFDQPLIESFWYKIGKEEPLERMEFLIENHIPLFFRGPITNLSKMMVLQSKTKHSRGSFLDSMHSIYITYCDIYFTADDHFIRLKDWNQIDPNMKKINHVDELNFKSTPINKN